MTIKLRTAKRTIKLRDRKKTAEHLFRSANIRRLIKPSKEDCDTQTTEGDATESTTDAISRIVQKASRMHHIQRQRHTKTPKRPAYQRKEAPTSKDALDSSDVQSPNVSTPLRQIDKNTTATHCVARPESVSTAPDSLPEITHVREAHVSVPKINSAATSSIKDAASSIRPKQSRYTVRRCDEPYPPKRQAKFQQIHARRTATAQAAAVKKHSKGKRITSTLKSVLRGTARTVGKLSAWLFGGAAGLLAPLIVVLVLGGLICSPLAIFLSGETDSELTLQSVMTQLNTEFSDKITEIENRIPHDDLQQTGQRAVWKHILTIYAVKISTDPEHPLDAATMDEQHADVLRAIFWDMNTIDYHAENYTQEEIVMVPTDNSTDEDGMVEEVQAVSKTRLIIAISSKTAEQMAEEYGFTQEQLRYITELLSAEYEELWCNLSYGGDSDGIVQVALSQVGNVGGQPYWSWYGFSSRVEWCACFVSWCGDQCGYVDSGIIPKFSYCPTGVDWFKSRGQWQGRGTVPEPGFVIFFDWNGDGESDHVGIVESCNGSTINTVEGNANNTCKIRYYTVGSRNILGYGIPAC